MARMLSLRSLPGTEGMEPVGLGPNAGIAPRGSAVVTVVATEPYDIEAMVVMGSDMALVTANCGIHDAGVLIASPRSEGMAPVDELADDVIDPRFKLAIVGAMYKQFRPVGGGCLLLHDLQKRADEREGM